MAYEGAFGWGARLLSLSQGAAEAAQARGVCGCQSSGGYTSTGEDHDLDTHNRSLQVKFSLKNAD